MINKFSKLLKNKSCLRFPPDPNGFLHIGHIFNILINYFLSFFKNGNFLIRFDNTNLSKTKIKFYYFIIYDLIWIGVKWHKIKFFLNEIRKIRYLIFFFLKEKKIYFKKKEELIRINFNFLHYLKIINFIIINCYKKKNISIFCKKKIIFRKKSKKKHKNIFPTYDFSQCFNDYFNNIKLSICTKEFLLNSKIYNFLLKKIKKKSIQTEFEKKKIKNVLISKKKLKKIFYLNIFYFRKLNFNPKKIYFLCNFLGISKNNSFIKNKNLKKSFLIEKKFFFCVNKNFFLFLKNFKKNIFLTKLNNEKNINLNFNIIIFKNFLNKLSFFIKKKVYLKKYFIIKNIFILIKF